MTHEELVWRAAKWLRNTRKCGVVVTQRFIVTEEHPDAIGWNSFGWSILVECKASRSDFFRDAKKSFRRWPEHGMGNRRYYLTPPGLLEKSEVPKGWGLLECHAVLKHRVTAPFHDVKAINGEMRLLLAHVRGGVVTEQRLLSGCLPDVGL